MDNFEKEQVTKAAELLNMILGYSQGRDDEYERNRSQLHLLTPVFNVEDCDNVKKSKKTA